MNAPQLRAECPRCHTEQDAKPTDSDPRPTLAKIGTHTYAIEREDGTKSAKRCAGSGAQTVQFRTVTA